MENEELSFNEKVEATIKFMQLVGNEETAKYIVHQQEAIDGLTANNQSFINSFRVKD